MKYPVSGTRILSQGKKAELDELCREFEERGERYSRYPGTRMSLEEYFSREKEILERKDDPDLPENERPLTAGVVQNLLKSNGTELKLQLAEQMASVLSTVQTLEGRLNEVAEQSLRYRGVWRDDASYQANEIVTHGGVLWCCITGQGKPGAGDGWRLMHKDLARTHR